MSREYLSARERRGIIIVAVLLIVVIGTAVFSNFSFDDSELKSVVAEDNVAAKIIEEFKSETDSIELSKKVNHKKSLKSKNKKRKKSGHKNKKSENTYPVRNPFEEEVPIK